MLILFVIIVIFIAIPLAYIRWFLIIELPKKLGYFKFGLVSIVYIIFFGCAVLLLTDGHLNFILFVIFNMLIDLPGVYYLRKEFISALKSDFTMKGDKDSDK